mmetsp:Transcript_98918/g.307665  ORF Transcript_98918/g.307665 Transcript_98918/m.307665 type:complete len:302 (-) Transcript_98918:343-1248(-)
MSAASKPPSRSRTSTQLRQPCSAATYKGVLPPGADALAFAPCASNTSTILEWPSWQARCNAVRPLPGSAQAVFRPGCSSKKTSTCSEPCPVAAMTGVAPSVGRPWLGSARFASRARAREVLSHSQAWTSSMAPASRAAPAKEPCAATSARAAALRPSWQASSAQGRCLRSGATRSSCSASRGAASSSARTVARSPCAAAQCSTVRPRAVRLASAAGNATSPSATPDAAAAAQSAWQAAACPAAAAAWSGVAPRASASCRTAPQPPRLAARAARRYWTRPRSAAKTAARASSSVGAPGRACQ